MKRVKDKFQFGIPFQEEVLHFIITDKMGALSLSKIQDEYFSLIEHQVIAKCLKKFYKKHKRIPSKVILKESISELTHTKTYSNLFTKEDFNNLEPIIERVYNHNLKDSDIISNKINQFAAFIKMKELQDNFDTADFNQYEEYANQVAKILLSEKTDTGDETIFLVKDVIHRQFERQANPESIPTPFRQLNNLANGGGYPKGSIMVFLDEAKATKTFTLINVARNYLRLKKNVLYIDTENGKREIMMRLEQSTLNKTKAQLISGEFDKAEQKHLRKYKRLGSEFAVRKIPANVGNANDVGKIIDEIYMKHGIKIHVLMVDFMGKMASLDKHKDDNERISNIYIEMANLAIDKEIEIVWTAQHVKREAKIRRSTRYEDSDVAKCIDISRHAQALIGLNSTDEERENKVQRWEMIVQRDGPPHGRCVFNIDLATQRLTEFTVNQRKEYDSHIAPDIDKKLKSSGTSKNSVANEEKFKKGKGGDLG